VGEHALERTRRFLKEFGAWIDDVLEKNQAGKIARAFRHRLQVIISAFGIGLWYGFWRHRLHYEAEKANSCLVGRWFATFIWISEGTT
jgi:hypothetical protein